MGRPLNGRWSGLEEVRNLWLAERGRGEVPGKAPGCRGAPPGERGKRSEGTTALGHLPREAEAIGVRRLEDMRALEPWVGRRAGGDIGNTVGEGSDLSFGAQERERCYRRKRAGSQGTASALSGAGVLRVGRQAAVTEALQAVPGSAPAPL